MALVFTSIFNSYYDSVASAQENDKLIPFFDKENNPVPVGFPAGENLDISPQAPNLNSFDRAVLKVCGTFGSRVSPNQFKQLLSYYPDVVEKLQKVTDGELRSRRKRRSDFIQDLTNIWFQNRGFEHIFCGEIYKEDDIGGLHFYGRYLQLQEEGIGGRLPNNDKMQEVVPGVIYTMGVMVKQGKRTITDVIKGYGYLSNAQEMLLDVTKIYKLQNNLEGACIFQVKDRETGIIFPTVFVVKNKAIITYYPDATPKGKKCNGSS
ncbi:MAG: EndoU domain-containing protein [Methylacidiphilales bacterium]|nr:EndoU domain-containing protein [Candidatus Methylacidiphilales bacterium]